MAFERPVRATRHCRHYKHERGLHGRGSVCARGIDLSVPASSAMCLPDGGRPRGLCSQREEYTDPERVAWREHLAAMMQRLAAAIAALPAPIPLNTSGAIECPNCGGELRYARWRRGAAIECRTENCCGAQMNIADGADWPSPKKPDPARVLQAATPEGGKHEDSE